MKIDRNARLSVAPMMDWTDRHCRYLHRVLSKQTLLYTEMVTAPALVRGGAAHLLRFDLSERPVALQLGGSVPSELATAARMGAEEGYDEINLNVGCPSDRVQSGAFGAILMRTPDLVADCVAAMTAKTNVPVTVKCRIGVDDQVAEEILPQFLSKLHSAGVRRVAIHARKAWLHGLSPKENRNVPPLDYLLAREMKDAFPDLFVSVNGGIGSLDEVEAHLADGFDGAMVGRAAYHAPWEILGDADRRIFGKENPCQNPLQAAERMIAYIEAHLNEGGRLHSVTRHMLGLFSGRSGARNWRRTLSDGAHRDGAGSEIVHRALANVRESQMA